MALNAALMKLRRERRPRQMSAGPVEEMDIVDWSPGPESQVLNTELKEKLEEALGLLPEDLRTAVVLRDAQQLSVQEAADVVDVSMPAFKARLHRGRIALRGYLADYVRTAKE